jgi:uncharacterized SAM-dependent methyltransferase
LVGSDFRLADWQHLALFNAVESRVEMHLQTVRDVQVRWPGGERHFVQGERIHTESSYKWQAADFERLLQTAGFARTQVWTDERGWFAVFWAAG